MPPSQNKASPWASVFLLDSPDQVRTELSLPMRCLTSRCLTPNSHLLGRHPCHAGPVTDAVHTRWSAGSSAVQAHPRSLLTRCPLGVSCGEAKGRAKKVKPLLGGGRSSGAGKRPGRRRCSGRKQAFLWALAVFAEGASLTVLSLSVDLGEGSSPAQRIPQAGVVRCMQMTNGPVTGSLQINHQFLRDRSKRLCQCEWPALPSSVENALSSGGSLRLRHEVTCLGSDCPSVCGPGDAVALSLFSLRARKVVIAWRD